MKPFRLAALSLALLSTLTLVGCDDNKEKNRAEAPASAAATPAEPEKVSKPDSATLEKLAAQSQGKPLTLLDASEVQLDGAATLVLTFSVPLDPSQDFLKTLHVVDKKSGKVDGAWELVPNLKEVRLRHLEPNRNLIVTVERDLLALNKATFGIDYEKAINTGISSQASVSPAAARCCRARWWKGYL